MDMKLLTGGWDININPIKIVSIPIAKTYKLRFPKCRFFISFATNFALLLFLTLSLSYDHSFQPPINEQPARFSHQFYISYNLKFFFICVKPIAEIKRLEFDLYCF